MERKLYPSIIYQKKKKIGKVLSRVWKKKKIPLLRESQRQMINEIWILNYYPPAPGLLYKQKEGIKHKLHICTLIV